MLYLVSLSVSQSLTRLEVLRHVMSAGAASVASWASEKQRGDEAAGHWVSYGGFRSHGVAPVIIYLKWFHFKDVHGLSITIQLLGYPDLWKPPYNTVPEIYAVFFSGFFGWFWCSSIFKVSQQQCRIWRVQCWRDCGWSSSLRLSAREEAVVRCHAASTAANNSSTMSVWQRSDGAAFGPRLCVWVALELNDWTLMCFVHFNGLICHTLGPHILWELFPKGYCASNFTWNPHCLLEFTLHDCILWPFMTIMFWWISQIPRLVQSSFIRAYHPIRRWNSSTRG